MQHLSKQYPKTSMDMYLDIRCLAPYWLAGLVDENSLVDKTGSNNAMVRQKLSSMESAPENVLLAEITYDKSVPY